MPLARGDRLGPYEVTAHIGAGGMGEVYGARDTRLNRDVAIKVLPALFANDPERLTRFTREAQTLASLNHPNVAQVYGVEGHALVMEFVPGEDLAQRIARGPIPIDDAIELAKQIACGLEAAHERGIVHRDLKPANVRITPAGEVKVLDFGLAKADVGRGFSPADSDGTPKGVPYNIENSPTFTSPPTDAGMILGTAAYMAPEQARGKPVDKRADIWAFGCVVYEMLTAKRPFVGETVTDTLAAIVKEDPDWAALPGQTPTALRELLVRCLVKDPKNRLRDIGDARIALEHAIADPAGRTRAPAAAVTPSRGRVWALVATALPVAAAAALITWLLVRPAPAPALPLSRFATPLPLDALPLRTGGTGVAFAPDGTTVVYAAQPALTTSPVLFQRKLNGLDVEKIAQAPAATAPFFSPDSRWIGFITDTAVMKVSIDGQGLAKISDRTRFSRAAWGPDDTIILGTSQIHSNGPLAKVSANGGTPADITTLNGNELAHQLPHVLPDGRHVLFSVISPGRSELAIAPIAGGAHQLLGLEGSGAMFVPPGHLLYARGRSLFAVPFDPRRNEVRGSPNQVLEDAGVFSGASNVWIPLVAADRAGSIAYLNKGGTLSTLRWIVPTSTPLSVPDGDYRTPRLSPDGRRVLVAASAAPSEIWVIDLDRGTRLLLAAGGGTAPIWSHDGKRIIYLAASGEIMTVPADGSGTPEVVLARQPSISVAPTAVASDGSFIVAGAEDRVSSPVNRNRDIWIIRPGQKPEPIVATPADERGGAVSPDSRWLAYSSSVSGREEVYIKHLAGSGRTIPVSSAGGILPRWPRMDSLYFLGPRALMRAPIGGDPLAAGAAVEIVVIPQNMGGIDIDKDGRILIIEPRAGGAGTRDALHVLLNWGRSLSR